uniref:Uncharacterized protein n=1 Tax=Quercus lobata TaxID=97700 RepID=A0A7N2LIQ5_QUELO
MLEARYEVGEEDNEEQPNQAETVEQQTQEEDTQPGTEDERMEETWEIQLTPELKNQLAGSWKTSVILKLMGRRMGYRALQTRCGRIRHKETQRTESLTTPTTVLPNETATHTPTTSLPKPAHVSTPWKIVQSRCSRTRGCPNESLQCGKTNLTEPCQVFHPRGQAPSTYTKGQRIHSTESVKRLEQKTVKQPPGFNCGKVATKEKKAQLRQPREIEQEYMQNQGDAACSRPPFQLNDMAVNDMHTPCMTSCNEVQKSPQDNAMQQGQAILPTLLTDPSFHDINQTYGSLIGPSFNLTHTNKSRPSTHTNTSRHPTYLNHTPHEQPSPSSPSLRAGNGEPRKALEWIVSRTKSRRDSELCPHTDSSADSHELEPSNSNTEPTSKARPTSPF